MSELRNGEKFYIYSVALSGDGADCRLRLFVEQRVKTSGGSIRAAKWVAAERSWAPTQAGARVAGPLAERLNCDPQRAYLHDLPDDIGLLVPVGREQPGEAAESTEVRA